jgi:hypothetical protein
MTVGASSIGAELVSGQRKEVEEVDSNPSLTSPLSDLHNSTEKAFHI